MGNHGRGPVNARRIDGCGIDRDQDAIYVSATRQLRIQTEAADILGREIDIDCRNENENKR